MILDRKNKIKLVFLLLFKTLMKKCDTYNRYNLSALKRNELHCFIYIALVKHWVINLGEFKTDQEYFAR